MARFWHGQCRRIPQGRCADAGQRDDGRVAFDRLQDWAACAPGDEQQGVVGKILQYCGLDSVFVHALGRGALLQVVPSACDHAVDQVRETQRPWERLLPPDSLSPLLPGAGELERVQPMCQPTPRVSVTV